MELVEFIRARLDEDEAVAHEARTANPGAAAAEWGAGEVEHFVSPLNWGTAWGVVPKRVRGVLLAVCPNDIQPRVSAHIVRHDPARVLREVEAKRAILALHRGERHDEALTYCVTCGSGEPYEYPTEWPCATLRLLALPYADHPDYRAEWDVTDSTERLT